MKEGRKEAGVPLINGALVRTWQRETEEGEEQRRRKRNGESAFNPGPRRRQAAAGTKLLACPSWNACQAGSLARPPARSLARFTDNTLREAGTRGPEDILRRNRRCFSLCAACPPLIIGHYLTMQFLKEAVEFFSASIDLLTSSPQCSRWMHALSPQHKALIS